MLEDKARIHACKEVARTYVFELVDRQINKRVRSILRMQKDREQLIPVLDQVSVVFPPAAAPVLFKNTDINVLRTA